jgi:transitional endoplasmic reticulum ATPase
LPSREGIFKANCRKMPLAANVSIKCLAENTNGFSGADIAELCQKAAKAAVRDAIE